MRRLSRRSSVRSRASSPTGLTILVAGTIRFEPTVRATGVIEQTWAAGMPTLSISLPSVAPQRVLVPQVEVRMTPDTPSAWSSRAIVSPSFLITSTLEATPVVL